jgi:effector-binding domain-containing protein/uncharacterized protein YndB with AHSA1/START domain
MKLLRLFITLLIVIIGVTAVLSLVMPVNQKLDKTISINAPAETIYATLNKLENIPTWSVWNRFDSSVKYTITGEDGTVGSYSTWAGDPQISGEGKIEITGLQKNKKIELTIEFISPEKGLATSAFLLNEKNGITTVTWTFSRTTPRPWNIFNLMYDMDKQMGKNLEEGLAALQSTVENKKGEPVKKKYRVQTMNFPATTFAIIRQEVQWNEISSFYSTHLPILHAEALKLNASPGTPAGLFYKWDEKNQVTDMAAAIPVSPEITFENKIIQIEKIPASKAVFVNYYGAYNQLASVYQSMDQYLAENNLQQKLPVIEQYIAGPESEKDTANWLTKIVFLVK